MTMEFSPGWWEQLTLTADVVANLRSRARARHSTTFDADFSDFWAYAAAPQAWARFSTISGELTLVYFDCPVTGMALKVDSGRFGVERVALDFHAPGRGWVLGWASE